MLASLILSNFVPVINDAREFISRRLSVGEDEIAVSLFDLLTKVLLVKWMINSIAFTVGHIPAIVPSLLILNVEIPFFL